MWVCAFSAYQTAILSPLFKLPLASGFVRPLHRNRNSSTKRGPEPQLAIPRRDRHRDQDQDGDPDPDPGTLNPFKANRIRTRIFASSALFAPLSILASSAYKTKVNRTQDRLTDLHIHIIRTYVHTYIHISILVLREYEEFAFSLLNVK